MANVHVTDRLAECPNCFNSGPIGVVIDQVLKSNTDGREYIITAVHCYECCGDIFKGLFDRTEIAAYAKEEDTNS